MIEIPGYCIERELGSGGMATVYLAVQESLGRKVALKVLAPQLAASDPGFTQRFLREGRIAASLRHRHIVAIHDVGVYQGLAYMALEYLPQGSLAAVGELTPREALRVTREIATALDVAHRNGVVHRDVKPENILREDDGGYVLSDFGIARMANASQVMTKEGSTVGTPVYMAPEQWRNHDVDGRADLYSLGVVLYQLLTGRVPYSGSDGWAIGMQHMQAPLPRLPSTLVALQAVLDRLLAKDRSERFPSGAALATAVAALERAEALPETLPSEFAQTRSDPTLPPWRVSPELAANLFDSRPGVDTRAVWYRRRSVLGGGGVLLLASLAAWWWPNAGGHAALAALLGQSDSLATVAVLPCDTSTNLAEQRELGDTLAEELIHRLGRLRALTVVARSSSFPLRDAGLDAKALGERLGATHLLACTIRRAPDGVRVRAELVDTRSGTQQWSAEYDRSGSELLAVVDELAVGISAQLLDQLAGPERALLIRHRTSSLEAVRKVQEGLARAQTFTLPAISEARGLIEQAIALAPDYAGAQIAMAELAGLEMQLAQRDGAWWRAKVEPLLARAFELDPEFAPAFVLRSQLRCAEYDWSGCRADVERALALEPGAAEVQANAAFYHRTLGSRERAVGHATKRAQIEPESPFAWDELATALIRAGRNEEALAVADRTIERFPGRWPTYRARAVALEQLGRCEEGVVAQDRALQLADNDIEVDSAAASLYVRAGQRERATARLREYETLRASGDPVNDMAFAVYGIALERKPMALDALEAMYGARNLRLVVWITSPIYGVEALGAEPRFRALLERLHLPPEAMSWQPGK